MGEEMLLTRGGGHVLSVAPDQIDAERFARLAADGRRSLGADDDARSTAGAT